MPFRMMCVSLGGGGRRMLLGLVQILILSCGGAAPLLHAGGPAWHVLETPRFTVVSQVNEKTTRAWAEEFNQYIQSLNGLFKLNELFLPRLTVVIFDGDSRFDAYRPVGPNGKVKENVAGYFGRRETWAVIGLPDRWDDEMTRSTIFHEGVHWFVSADARRYPPWLNEGLAELFETYSARKDTVTWGSAIEAHVTFLSRRRYMPLKKLVLVSDSAFRSFDQENTTEFYAESWAFVHYLVFGQRKGKQGSLSDFITAYNNAATTEEAFETAFGQGAAAMDEELEAYLRGGKYRIHRKPIAAGAGLTASFLPAAPARVEVALAKLALITGRKDLAQRHADEAVRLDPALAEGYRIRAWLKIDDPAPDEFLAAAEKAAQTGARDADTMFLLGMARFKKAISLGGVPADQARPIANLFERAINQQPSAKSAYKNLAAALQWVEQPSDQDVEFIKLGCMLYPEEAVLRVGAAQLLRKGGAKEESCKALRAIVADTETVSPEERRKFSTILSSWESNDAMDGATTLAKQKRFKEAMALLDAVERSAMLPMNQAELTRRRWDMWARATMQDAEAARVEGRLDESTVLLKSVIENTKVKERLRNQARSRAGALSASPGAAPPAE